LWSTITGRSEVKVGIVPSNRQNISVRGVPGRSPGVKARARICFDEVRSMGPEYAWEPSVGRDPSSVYRITVSGMGSVGFRRTWIEPVKFRPRSENPTSGANPGPPEVLAARGVGLRKYPAELGAPGGLP
jgi:hypothetical protein